MELYWWWLIIGVLLIIIEMISVDFIFVMLGIGAISAGVVSIFAPKNLLLQVAVFCVISILLLLLLRPWAKSHLHRSQPNIKTNVEALVGCEAVVLQAVNTQDGQVRLHGEVWSARSSDGEIYGLGTKVIVTQIAGAVAIVKESKSDSEQK